MTDSDDWIQLLKQLFPGIRALTVAEFARAFTDGDEQAARKQLNTAGGELDEDKIDPDELISLELFFAYTSKNPEPDKPYKIKNHHHVLRYGLQLETIRMVADFRHLLSCTGAKDDQGNCIFVKRPATISKACTELLKWLEDSPDLIDRVVRDIDDIRRLSRRYGELIFYRTLNDSL